MQTDRYDYAPIIRRKPFKWPNHARIALVVAPNIEFFHIDKVIPGAPGSQLPDVTGYALRDYGSRIGVFRMMDVLDKHGIRATVLLNADVCAHHPAIIEEGNQRNWEWLGHGVTNNIRMNQYPAAEERAVVKQIKDTIAAATGKVPRGWLGVTIQRVTPELAKSFRLPETRGALVSAVVEGSPAQTAGLKPGDVIVAYNGRTVARSDELPRAVAATPVGREVPLSVLRDGKTVALTAKIARLAEVDEAASPASGEKPRLGLQLQTLTPKLAAELGLRDRSGVLVRGVEDGSPAAGAGLRPGDVIAEIDHRPVKNVEDLKETMARHAPGTPTLLLVHREHGNLYIAIGS